MTIVLLVAYVFVSTAHAESMRDAQQSLAQSQEETSKIKSQLEEVQTDKVELSKQVTDKDARIQQLEEENSELKE